MAAALYYLTIAAVILIGLSAGRRARSIIHAGLVGLIGNLVMVAALFLATIAFAVLAPGSIDPTTWAFASVHCCCSAPAWAWWRRSAAGATPPGW